MPSLLLITYEFPPKGGVGVLRPLKAAKYLAMAGWDVTVLTVADPPAAMFDPDLLDELPPSVRVERAWSLEPTRLVQLLKRRRRESRADARSVAPPGGESADSPHAASEPGSRGISGLSSGFIRFIQAFFIPDEKLWWTPWAVRLSKQLHRVTPFDVILASGPPFTALGVARRLARSLGIPWVADLRDPIVGGYFFRPATPIHAALMRAYERRVVRSAGRIVTATDAMRLELAARLPDRRDSIVTVTNGFDRVDFTGPAPQMTPGFTAAYVGTFQGEISADTLLDAFARAGEADDAFAHDARLRVVGPRDSDTELAIERTGTSESVDRVGFVGHRAAIAEMRSATILILVLGPSTESAGIITGKLPEYLAAGRPILALAPEGEAARLIRRAGAGWVVGPRDVRGVADALLEAYGAWRAGTLPVADPAVVAEYDRQRLVERVSNLLEEVVADASRA